MQKYCVDKTNTTDGHFLMTNGENGFYVQRVPWSAVAAPILCAMDLRIGLCSCTTPLHATDDGASARRDIWDWRCSEAC